MFREKKNKFATMQNITSAKRGGGLTALDSPCQIV